jgi:hypothetical protein
VRHKDNPGQAAREQSFNCDKFNKISVVFIHFVVYFIGHLGLCECKELNDCYTSSVFQVDSLICYYYYYLFFDAIFGNVSIEIMK